MQNIPQQTVEESHNCEECLGTKKFGLSVTIYFGKI